MQITLSTGTERRIKMYLCSIKNQQIILSLEIGALSVLLTLNPQPSEQSLVSVQVILEAEVPRQDWKCKRFRWERSEWIKGGKGGVGREYFQSAVLKGDMGGKIL